MLTDTEKALAGASAFLLCFKVWVCLVFGGGARGSRGLGFNEYNIGLVTNLADSNADILLGCVLTNAAIYLDTIIKHATKNNMYFLQSRVMVNRSSFVFL